MPGFSGIMPGIRARMMHQGHAPDYDTRSTAPLGTQLVQVLVRQLGGVMTVTSENGARFEIVFPEKF